jgi:Fic family protein
MAESRDLIHSILTYIQQHPDCSSKEIWEDLQGEMSYATVKRYLLRLVNENKISLFGKGKNTHYGLTAEQELFLPINLDLYFQQETDERNIRGDFHYELLTEILPTTSIFSEEETDQLNRLHQQYKKNLTRLNSSEINKELNRWAIDLSWKSSQIEGNTYTLLETERLLNERITTSGKTQEEAIMLLNHKEAIQFLIEHPDYLSPLTIAGIEDIHKILVRNLNIPTNLRRVRIGISGTNYRPSDNEYQIREGLQAMCTLIEGKSNPYEKAFLALVLLAYIQPFSDGNKRTSRIVCNAMLMHHGYCPLSFRTVDSLEYKKAIVVFYERNNLTAMKRLFMEQVEFAVGGYF